MKNPIVVAVDSDDLRETLIALRDRHFTLTKEYAKFAAHQDLRAIVVRQLTRVVAAHNVLASAVDESPLLAGELL